MVITCDVRGAPLPAADLPTIVSRAGIDLEPLSPADEDDARWLRACVWPDDVDRMSRLDAALRVAGKHDDVRLVRGNAVTDLPAVVADVPEGTGPFVEPFASQQKTHATTPPDDERFLVGLSWWSDGRRTDELLARSQPHGAWIEWLSTTGAR